MSDYLIVVVNSVWARFFTLEPVEFPEFAPLLKEALSAAGEVYLLSNYEVTVCCTVPMAVAGQDNMEMELKVSEAILTNVKWRT